jgi:lysine 2,3-aminomutase
MFATSHDPIPETDLTTAPVTRGRFNSDRVRDLLRRCLGEEEFARLVEAGVDRRMIFGVHSYYLALTTGTGFRSRTGAVLPVMPPSRALLALVMPNAQETADLSGEPDPSNQNRYSPVGLKGKIVHKYDEIVLSHTAIACSAHCRYCYRLDLFNRSTGKAVVTPDQLRDYVFQYNQRLAAEAPAHSFVGGHRSPVTEVLLSGGDPLVLSNRKLYRYLVAAAEAGVSTIRIGTKEIAFRPERFDSNFMQMLLIFRRRHPNVHVKFMMHFTHPDEFLERDIDGNYVPVENIANKYKWLAIVEGAVHALRQLDFVSLENQTAMIRLVNDDPRALHILHKELCHKGIKPEYTLQCREIEGHKFFAVPVEAAWKIHNISQQGLTISERSRFAMSTECGKLEVVSVVDDDIQELAVDGATGAKSAICPSASGLVVFKILRSPGSGDTQGRLVLAKRNPEALWISDYEDRIIFDGRPQDIENTIGRSEVAA